MMLCEAKCQTNGYHMAAPRDDKKSIKEKNMFIWTIADPQGLDEDSHAQHCLLKLCCATTAGFSYSQSRSSRERMTNGHNLKGNKLCLIYSLLHICILWEYQILQGWKKTFLPREVLAGTASLLIQNDTHERTTVSIQGMYVWIVKYPMRLLRSKNIVIII